MLLFVAAQAGFLDGPRVLANMALDRWMPTKIRLLRKTGRVDEANALTLKCSVDAPDWRKLCQEANQTPAGRARRAS